MLSNGFSSPSSNGIQGGAFCSIDILIGYGSAYPGRLSCPTQRGYTFAEKGDAPLPQRQERGSLRKYEYLLVAAYAMNIRAGGQAHRFALIALLMTLCPGLSVESVQAMIQDQRYWKPRGNGYYVLTDYGEWVAWNDLCTPNLNAGDATAADQFRFFRRAYGRDFEIRIFPRSRKTIIIVDGSAVSGTEAYDILVENRANFRSQSSRSTGCIWNWIVQDNNYRWERYTWHGQ